MHMDKASTNGAETGLEIEATDQTRRAVLEDRFSAGLCIPLISIDGNLKYCSLKMWSVPGYLFGIGPDIRLQKQSQSRYLGAYENKPFSVLP